MELKSQGVPAETALREIQPVFSAFGDVVKKSVQPDAVAAQTSEVTELVSAVKSLAESLSAFQQNVSTELATLKAQVAVKPVVTEKSIPTPRSLTGKIIPDQPQPSKPLSISEIAYRSTFR